MRRPDVCFDVPGSDTDVLAWGASQSTASSWPPLQRPGSQALQQDTAAAAAAVLRPKN